MTGRAGGRSFTLWLALAAVVLGSAAFAWPASSASPTSADTLLVADLRGQTLIVLDPHRNEVQRVIPLPGGPHELLRLPDGRIAVSIEQSGLIAFVDVDTGEVELLEVGGVPHGLAFGIEEYGDLLLVTDRSVDLVRRLVVGGWQELTPVAVDAWPHAVATLPDGTLAVANAGAGTLQIGARRIETGAVTETVAVSAAGFISTASAFEGAVWLFDVLGDLVARYEVGGRPVRVVFSPRGDVLAVARSASGSVAVIEAGEVREFTVAGVPDGLAFSSDGRWLYVSDVFGGAVTVVDLARGEVASVLPVGEATGAILLLER